MVFAVSRVGIGGHGVSHGGREMPRLLLGKEFAEAFLPHRLPDLSSTLDQPGVPMSLTTSIAVGQRVVCSFGQWAQPGGCYGGTLRGYSCREYGLAIDDDIDHADHGSWLTVRVVSAEGNPPACGLARQLTEAAFGNPA